MLDHDHREWPLVFFTILIQLAVGLFVLWGLPAVFTGSTLVSFWGKVFSQAVITTVLTALMLGGIAAVSHLGRVPGAVFSLRNWRSSWLSREAWLAGGFGTLVLTCLLLVRAAGPIWLQNLDLLAGFGLGLSLVYAISRLYRLRTVPVWNTAGTPASFILTTFLTGISVLVMLQMGLTDQWTFEHPLLVTANGGIILLVFTQAAVFGVLVLKLNRQGGAGAASVRILSGRLLGVVLVRWLAAGLGVLLIFTPLPGLAALPYLLVLISEITGRWLFYAAYQRTGY